MNKNVWLIPLLLMVCLISGCDKENSSRLEKVEDSKKEEVQLNIKDSMDLNSGANNYENISFSIDTYNKPFMKINDGSFDELIEDAKQESEKEMASYMDDTLKNSEKYLGMDFLGYYALFLKENARDRVPFILYTVYKVNINNTRDGDVSYYWYCSFSGLAKVDSTHYIFSLDDCITPINTYVTPSEWFFYSGYGSVDDLFQDTVGVYETEYDWVSTVVNVEEKNSNNDENANMSKYVANGDYQWTYKYKELFGYEYPDQIGDALESGIELDFDDCELIEKSKKCVSIVNSDLLFEWGYTEEDIEYMKSNFYIEEQVGEMKDNYNLSVIEGSKGVIVGEKKNYNYFAVVVNDDINDIRIVVSMDKELQVGNARYDYGQLNILKVNGSNSVDNISSPSHENVPKADYSPEGCYFCEEIDDELFIFAFDDYYTIESMFWSYGRTRIDKIANGTYKGISKSHNNTEIIVEIIDNDTINVSYGSDMFEYRKQ